MRDVFRTIKTERLVLHRFQMANAAAIGQTVGDYEVARWLPLLSSPYGIKDARSFIELLMSDAAEALAVKHNRALIGCITIMTDLGYWFARGSWGNGSARAVVAARFSISDTNLVSGHLRGNRRSRSVLLKLGFTDTNQTIRRSNNLGEDVTIQRIQLCPYGWEARK